MPKAPTTRSRTSRNNNNPPPRKPPQTTTNKPPTNPKKSKKTTTYNPAKHSLASLPYHILTTILHYASATPPSPYPDTTLLLNTLTLCRTLYEPTLAVLYHTPPTHTLSTAHRLLHTLRERVHLRPLVKALVVEVEPLLVTRAAPHGAWDICEFLRLASGVREVDIRHPSNGNGGSGSRAWATVAGRQWRYPAALWSILDEAGTLLRGWTWRGEFMDGVLDLDGLKSLHSQRAFSGLRRVGLVGIESNYDEGDMEGDFSREEGCAEVLTLLQSLKEVSFEDCTIVNDHLFSTFIPKAPSCRLSKLEFTNCPRLTSLETNLPSLLQSPLCASTLTSLTISNSPACNLTFTLSLPATLQTLSYTAPPTSSPPLLPMPPTPSHWPRDLTSLTLLLLKFPTQADCAALLSSLISAAPRLTAMHDITLWCILDVNWRARGSFREMWVGRVKDAFGRCWNGGGGGEVRFDNSRPAEKIFSESDFLDFGSGEVRGRRGRRGRRGGAVGILGVRRVVESDDEDYVE
ncbi:hypothetical protein L873DRAFT_1683399 [Choiromyces venosus 120613-1]|uniref:Uncharacterized protein n=1 Tax=Choiromyces venosus 120613-1 TaxID=1336337 RepID=A0A3N4K0T3_9PEZI|nr:hypothetical protein L873DRAFT_1683399 [Choiromyces venosus 120613-1]